MTGAVLDMSVVDVDIMNHHSHNFHAYQATLPRGVESLFFSGTPTPG